MKNMWAKTRDLLKKGALSALMLHGATQITFWGNDLYHRAWPSETRKAFHEQFGFPIKGWAEEIEDPQRIAQIANALAIEQAEEPVNIRSVRIQSRNYFKNNIVDQMSRLFTVGNVGYYLPYSRRIVISSATDISTLHHEIKHAKTYSILAKEPSFRTRWEALSTDENGRSLYRASDGRSCVRLKWLNWFVSDETTDRKSDNDLGFISPYARTNFQEDVAEIGEMAERRNAREILGLTQGPEGIERIIQKISLAEEYGIIPQGFSEYLLVAQAYQEIFGVKGRIRITETDRFMEKSKEFLQRHPSHPRAGELLYERGLVMVRTATTLPSAKFTLEQAEKELLDAIQTPVKEPHTYMLALKVLAEVKEQQGQPDKAEIFEDAWKEYRRRESQGDMQLVIRGVNDVLQQYGALSNTQ